MEMKLKIRKHEPQSMDIPRYVSINISDIPTNDMAQEIKEKLTKELPKIVAKCGGQLTIEESEKGKKESDDDD